MQIEFLHEFLKELKPKKIHVCLETCGYYNSNSFLTHIFPYIDLIYFDLKLFDPILHKHYCGLSNELILQNFEKLANKNKIELIPRIPLIPNITILKENLQSWVNYLKKFSLQKIGLLPYNPLWISKMSTLGKLPRYAASDWLTEDQKTLIKAQFSDFEYRDF
jgi:pyruvate formate lyase activating enzyme